MAYARRNRTLDICNNRAWTADAVGDLASIPARHGDYAYVTATGGGYQWLDGIGWRESPDYVEDTWTPALTFGGASTGITYSAQTGVYTQVGRLVAWQFRLVLTSKGSATGAANVSLPSSSGSLGVFSGGQVVYADSLSGLAGAVLGAQASGGSDLELAQTTATGTTAIADTEFTNTTTLAMAGFYMVD